jgi:hypothetical protein
METLASWVEELEQLLEQVSKLLEAVYTLPFRNLWVVSAPGVSYLQTLNALEQALVQFWEASRKQPPEELELRIREWSYADLRDPDGVWNSARSWVESLEDELLTQRGSGHPADWSGFLEHAMLEEPHLLARLQQANSVPDANLKALAEGYLEAMQPVHQVSLMKLLRDFYTLLSPFTQKSLLLPDLHRPLEVPEFQLALEQADRWNDFCEKFRQKLLSTSSS